MSGFRGNALFAVKLGRTGDLTGTDAIAWTHNKSTPYVPSPCSTVTGSISLETKRDSDGARCEKCDTLVDAERLAGIANIYASPVVRWARLHRCSRRQCARAEKRRQSRSIGTNKLNDRFDASPAVVGRELFLRGKQYLLHCCQRIARRKVRKQGGNMKHGLSLDYSSRRSLRRRRWAKGQTGKITAPPGMVMNRERKRKVESSSSYPEVKDKATAVIVIRRFWTERLARLPRMNC